MLTVKPMVFRVDDCGVAKLNGIAVATVPSRRNRNFFRSGSVQWGGGVRGRGRSPLPSKKIYSSIASRQPVVEPEVIVLIQYYSTYSVLYRLVGRLGFSSKG